MTSIAIRHRLSALAATALVFAVAGSSASARDYVNRARGMVFPPGQAGGVAERAHGFAAQRSAETPYGYRSEYTARATALHYQWRWWQDYTN